MEKREKDEDKEEYVRWYLLRSRPQVRIWANACEGQSREQEKARRSFRPWHGSNVRERKKEDYVESQTAAHSKKVLARLMASPQAEVAHQMSPLLAYLGPEQHPCGAQPLDGGIMQEDTGSQRVGTPWGHHPGPWVNEGPLSRRSEWPIFMATKMEKRRRERRK